MDEKNVELQNSSDIAICFNQTESLVTQADIHSLTSVDNFTFILIYFIDHSLLIVECCLFFLLTIYFQYSGRHHHLRSGMEISSMVILFIFNFLLRLHVGTCTCILHSALCHFQLLLYTPLSNMC